MTSYFDQVIRAVSEERAFQDMKHGPIVSEGHTIGAWLLILESELNEAKLAAIKGGKGRDSVRAELVQIAAVAVAALEQHGLIDPDDGRRQI